eukprot:563053-Amphidinium_carterae.1
MHLLEPWSMDWRVTCRSDSTAQWHMLCAATHFGLLVYVHDLKPCCRHLVLGDERSHGRGCRRGVHQGVPDMRTSGAIGQPAMRVVVKNVSVEVTRMILNKIEDGHPLAR